MERDVVKEIDDDIRNLEGIVKNLEGRVESLNKPNIGGKAHKFVIETRLQRLQDKIQRVKTNIKASQLTIKSEIIAKEKAESEPDSDALCPFSDSSSLNTKPESLPEQEKKPSKSLTKNPRLQD